MRTLTDFVIVAVIVFVAFAVCGWSLNPGHWGGFWRGLWIFITIALGVAAFNWWQENKEK